MSPAVEEILERLIAEPDFRAEFRRDARAAVAGYDLTPEDVEILASQLSDDTRDLDPVEQRTSKSALFSLFAGLSDAAGAPASEPEEITFDDPS